jgi:hypothetical protein
MASGNRDTPNYLNLVGVNIELEPTCEIEVTRRVQANIGGHRVDLAPSVKHRVVLNVRDVLKASGVLV